MPYVVVGLGNPGEEYENTRHNTGRMVVSSFLNEHADDNFISKKKIKTVMPDTFMNNSGKAVAPLVKNPDNLIVVYDDFNLPLGSIRVSYNRSSGGHNGLQSVIKYVKTEAFVRVRVGVAPLTPSGKIKVPHGEEAIEKFILGEFKDAELKILKKSIKKAVEAIDCIILESREKAMSVFNAQ